jgi:MFS family permease
LLTAVCCVSSLLLLYIAVSPILSVMQKSFPDATPSQIQMVYTTILLASIPSMLLAGVLTRLASKKALCVAGMLIMMAGGLMPLVLRSRLWMLYLGSGVTGIGMGIINIISSALISDHFKGLEKGKIMGYQSAAVSTGSAICTLLSGKIAETAGWHVSYAVFLFVLPMLVVFILLMPADKKQDKVAPVGKIYSKRLSWWAFIGFLWAVFMTAFQTNIAMFIEEAGFGGTGLSGAVSALFLLLGIPAGFTVGLCMKKLGPHAAGAASLLSAVGMLTVAAAQSVAVLFIGAFLFGAGFAVRTPVAITCATYLAPESAAAPAIAIANAGMSVGSFVSPAVVNSLASFTDGTFRSTFFVCGLALIAVSLLYLFLNPVRGEDMLESAKG